MKRKWYTTYSMMLVILILSITHHLTAQTITSNQTGINDGYYFSFWNAGGGTVTMTLGAGGNYSVEWTSCNNFTCGKGWKPGSEQTISYKGSFNGGSNGYLALYGWTKDSLIEYYVIENYGQWTPPGGTSIGTVTSDGGTYKIYLTTRTNQPSIIGTATFKQFWSVRTSKRSSGIISFSNHVDAWANLGMNLGSTWDYQIMVTEGYKSSGSSDITVKAGIDSSYIVKPPSVVVNTKETNGMVYPNRVTDVLHIAVNNISDGVIYSATGAIVKKFVLQMGINTIDVNDLQAGLYIVKFYNEGQTIAQKIIK
jgi:hypothetical protein